MRSAVAAVVILLSSTCVYAADQGARYKETSPGIFECVLPDGSKGRNPEFIGECGLVSATSPSPFQGMNFRNLIASGSIWGSETPDAYVEAREMACDSAQMQGLRFQRMKMDGVSFQGTDLERSSWESVYGQGANFANANLHGATFMNFTFTGALMNHASFESSDMDSVRLDGSSLRYANFQKAKARSVSFQTIDFTGADFREFNCLSYCNFDGALIASADLRGADLVRASFHAAYLHGAVFNESTRLPFSRATALRLGMIERP